MRKEPRICTACLFSPDLFHLLQEPPLDLPEEGLAPSLEISLFLFPYLFYNHFNCNIKNFSINHNLFQNEYLNRKIIFQDLSLIYSVASVFPKPLTCSLFLYYTQIFWKQALVPLTKGMTDGSRTPIMVVFQNHKL